MGCKEKEVAEWCKSLECRMGDLRIEATKLFMQANCFMEREALSRRLQQLNSLHDSLYSEFLLIEVHEDRLPADIRWLRGVFNTFDSHRKKIVKIVENERKAKEFVEALPIVTISGFHVDDGLFCGVCRDDLFSEKMFERFVVWSDIYFILTAFGHGLRITILVPSAQRHSLRKKSQYQYRKIDSTVCIEGIIESDITSGFTDLNYIELYHTKIHASL